MMPLSYIPPTNGAFECEPEDQDELLREIFYQAARFDLEYVDTLRATPVHLGFSHHYTKQSCCGVWEATYKYKSGNKYFIGCNHGH